jgi:putative ABC transport system permease protein
VAVVRVPLVKGFGPTGRLAADALARNPGRTTVTVAALVLSLAVAVGAGTALGSYERQVDATASALVGADLYVVAESYSGFTSDQPLPIELRKELNSVEGVRYVYPLRFALVNIGDQQGLIFAVPAQEVIAKGATTDVAAITSDPDAFLDGLEAGGVAITPGTAERHDLAVGDRISLPTPTGERDFEVAALYNDLITFDSLYMDYETYARLWEDDKADEFGVLFEDGVDGETARRRIADVVRAEGVAANVFTQEELVGRILEIVEGSLSLGRGIQLAALVVAALTIANTMFTVVLERRWETGLQRALGMSGGLVARMVLIEAAAIGLIGGMGGAILGTVNGYLMTQVMEAQFAWRIAFNPSAVLLVLAVGGGTILAAVAGALPCRAAARAPIIESLRYE